MSFILILGAASDIAKATAIRFAVRDYDLYLAGRNLVELEKDANDLRIRYAIQAKAVRFDVLNWKSHQEFYDSLDPKPSGLIFAVGYLGNQETAQNDFNEARRILDTNLTGIVSISEIVASDFERRKEGFVIGIGSVAGDRGRKSNYVYGSAKAGISTYLSGLRGRLCRVGIPVLTVKPGFVRTKMTASLDLPEKLLAEPDEVAADIFKAWKKEKHEIYTKWFWKYIMLIIKNIPERFFKKMDL